MDRGIETSCYLLESLADLLGLELAAEMLKLSVGKFSLTDYMLRRLFAVVPWGDSNIDKFEDLELSDTHLSIMSLTLHPGTLKPARSKASFSSPNSMKPDSSLSMVENCSFNSSFSSSVRWRSAMPTVGRESFGRKNYFLERYSRTDGQTMD